MKNREMNSIEAGFRRRRIRKNTVTAVLGAVVLVLCVLMLLCGNTFYPLDIVIRAVMGEQIQGASFAGATLRLPRMLAALFAGFAFGIAGSAFQTILRNPLASPDIIGVTSGASVAAVFCILVLKISGGMVSAAAVAASLLTSAAIYLLSKKGSFSGGRLIIIGIGVQAMLSAAVSMMLLKASQYDVAAAFRWLSGSLNGMQMENIPPLFLALLVFSPVLFILGRQLRILELGEDAASTLGVRTNIVRILLITSAVALVSFATSVTGPIAFVSFLSGPIAAKMVGKGRGAELGAGFTGALLVLGSDLIGQFALGTRFPAGIITGILGAPYLIFLLIRINKSGGAS